MFCHSNSIQLRHSALIVLGITLLYTMQLGISPLLRYIAEEFGVVGDSYVNLATDIVFVGIVIGSLWGMYLVRTLGTYNSFVLALAVCSCSCISTIWIKSYLIFLVGRVLYGIGFGIGVPVIGSAIMEWYPPHRRERMDTINALFPFAATLVAYPATEALSVRAALGWRAPIVYAGFAMALLLFLWLICVPKRILPIAMQESAASKPTAANTHQRRSCMLLLSITFACDFCCYAYVGIILPNLLYETAAFSASVSGVMAALLFPAIGGAGCLIGGRWMRHIGRQKPFLVSGQLIKFAGLTLAAGSGYSIVLLCCGIALYGFGNGFWIPAMYYAPMALPEAQASDVAKAFSIMTAVATLFGFVAPTVGGWLTQLITATGLASTHAQALQKSLFGFGLLNIIGFFCMCFFRGKSKKAQQITAALTEDTC